MQLKRENYNLGAGLAFGPNAQRVLKIIGVNDALERVSQNPSIDPDLWYLPDTHFSNYFNSVLCDIGLPLRLARQSML